MAMTDDVPQPATDADDIEKQLRAVLDDASTPAWVRALLTLVMLLVSDLRAEIARLRVQVYATKSERTRTPRAPKVPGDKKQPRRGSMSKKAPLETASVDVPMTACACSCCGSDDLSDCGVEQTEQVERIPERLVRRVIRRHKKICRHCETIMTAPAPPECGTGSDYGPGLHAHVAVSKCIDSMPLHRQARQLERLGYPIARSTLGDMFARTATMLQPLYDLVRERLREEPYLHADETPIGIQAKDRHKRGYVWVFSSPQYVVYVFSANRSGETPSRLLKGTSGYLQVDGYTGYNDVTMPDGRVRVGCLAHARRKFVEALPTEPERAGWVVELIGEIYRYEAEVRAAGATGMPEHAKVRQERIRPMMECLERWMREQTDVRPKSPLGKAIGYVTNQWSTLLHPHDDPALDLDNNEAERRLRLVAMGRNNFVCVGSLDAGHALAVIQTLVTMCTLHEVNPTAWLTDVLMRITRTDAEDLEQLLPQHWAPAA